MQPLIKTLVLYDLVTLSFSSSIQTAMPATYIDYQTSNCISSSIVGSSLCSFSLLKQ